MARLVVDVETYKDYFLVLFKEIGSDVTHSFEMHSDAELDMPALSHLMRNNTTISFNGNHYDQWMISAALMGFDNERLKKMSDRIILSGDPAWKTCRKFDVEIPRNAYGKLLWNHIDLIDVAHGQASLKIYGGRLNAPKLQDLPIKPDDNIRPEDRSLMWQYCLNDLETTELLYLELEKEVELRISMSKQHRVDLRSKGGAQVAKAVLQSELSSVGVSVSKPKNRVNDRFKYKDPGFISFETDTMREAFERVKAATFCVQSNGQIAMPESLNAAISFDGANYKFGIGGLHSQEKRQAIVCDDNHILAERDVASMYPNIILGQRMYPESLGPKFLDVYEGIVDRRLKAKHAGDKATSESLKLVINSSFGLFGSKYAFLYAPELMIQVTITGQLSLLMLIERTVGAGARVVSANTDGVVSLCPTERYADLETTCFDWELQTALELEETRYNALYSRDVNSYVAVKPDGSVKGKGAFADRSISKNPQFLIVTDAVKDYLSKGVPIEQTVNACSDVTRFLMVRSVTGGAEWQGEYLGKAVRFYYSKDVDQDVCIRYAKNENKVPVSDGCRPMMELSSSVPKDVDRARYIKMAYEILEDLGL